LPTSTSSSMRSPTTPAIPTSLSSVPRAWSTSSSPIRA
jgi:hypothetical protein